MSALVLQYSQISIRTSHFFFNGGLNVEWRMLKCEDRSSSLFNILQSAFTLPPRSGSNVECRSLKPMRVNKCAA